MSEKWDLEKEVDNAIGPWGGPNENVGPYNHWHLLGGALLAVLVVLALWWVRAW